MTLPGTPDDEDGVTLPAFTAGKTATVVVNSSGTGKLNAFFDWNNDGDFLDAGEAITELSVVAGNNNLSVPVPAGAVTGVNLGARFRVSSAGGLTALGAAPDGEVEDYLVSVQKPGAIGNYVWVDENSDGYQDAGEPGLPNVDGRALRRTTGAEVARTVTDTDGGYLFDEPGAGRLLCRRAGRNRAARRNSLPTDLTQTHADARLPGADFGNQDHSTTAIPDARGFTGYPVTIGAGEENLTADFGYNYNPSDGRQRRHRPGRPRRPRLDRRQRRRRAGRGRAGIGGVTVTIYTIPTATASSSPAWTRPSPAPSTRTATPVPAPPPPSPTAATSSPTCRPASTWSWSPRRRATPRPATRTTSGPTLRPIRVKPATTRPPRR